MNNFVTNELQEAIVAGHTFKFREMKGSEMDAITDSSITVMEGRMMISIAKQREGWLSAIVDIDFPEWKNLNTNGA